MGAKRGKRKRARIIESWYKEFDTDTQSWGWNRYLWNMQGGIYKVEISPFKQKTHPFVISKFYIDEKTAGMDFLEILNRCRIISILAKIEWSI
ncbi:portal protein [Helicobacter cinaedi]|uniref:Portal protein n=1 Tax=Helicobacter cinaedi TaxID=213 RepID=A0A377JX96_9HELI|nr:portal protein [Helicobacter cinaedi]